MWRVFAVIVMFIIASSSPAAAQFNQQKRRANRYQQTLSYTQVPITKSKSLKKAVIAPVILATCGLISTTKNDLLNKYEIQEELREWAPNFRHHADDYLQYAPIIAVYGLNVMGVKGKNNFRNRTALLVKSELLTMITTCFLKRVTAIPRPDSGAPTSFPSGHTSQAFAAATFMAKEYGHKSIGYSIGAYSVATTVGVMRVLNNRHWISDVLVGASIGILSTNLVYLTHRFKEDKKKNAGQTLIIPSYSGDSMMLCMFHRFGRT